MELPPYFDELLLEPADPLFTDPLICAHCGGTTQTAFGYVRSSVLGAEEKPTVYLADWMPTHTEYGITVVVAQGELHEDEAVNMRTMAFSLQHRPGGGGNLTLINAKDTRFAKALGLVFNKLLSASAAQEDADLEFFHAIAIKVMSDEPRLNLFFLNTSPKEA